MIFVWIVVGGVVISTYTKRKVHHYGKSKLVKKLFTFSSPRIKQP